MGNVNTKQILVMVFLAAVVGVFIRFNSDGQIDQAEPLLNQANVLTQEDQDHESCINEAESQTAINDCEREYLLYKDKLAGEKYSSLLAKVGEEKKKYNSSSFEAGFYKEFQEDLKDLDVKYRNFITSFCVMETLESKDGTIRPSEEMGCEIKQFEEYIKALDRYELLLSN